MERSRQSQLGQAGIHLNFATSVVGKEPLSEAGNRCSFGSSSDIGTATGPSMHHLYLATLWTEGEMNHQPRIKNRKTSERGSGGAGTPVMFYFLYTFFLRRNVKGIR